MDNDKHKEQRTTGAIDTAYGSYHVVIMSILDQYCISSHFARKLKKLRTDYDWQWAIDKRQNVAPIIEKPEKAILKACQYAQAVLVRDLHQHYRDILTVPGLKDWADQLISVSPCDISLHLAESAIDIQQLHDTYLNKIKDPTTAAKVIGEVNSTASLVGYTAHNCISDNTLEERISEAFSTQVKCGVAMRSSVNDYPGFPK